jgi:hypothetical protein
MNTFDLVLYIMGGTIGAGLAVLGGTVSSTKSWQKTAFVVLGIASVVISIFTGVRASREASEAKDQAQRNIDQIEQQLTESEIKRSSDTRYLEGKLEVFGQFAPAVLKLARASELNTRKQYEQKVLSNKELKDFVTTVVKKMRGWQAREDNELAESRNKYFAATSAIYEAHKGGNIEPAQMRQELSKAFTDNIAADDGINRKFRAEFEQSILGDAISAREQLIIKLGVGSEPEVGVLNRSSMAVFQGIIVGPEPITGAAEYLERFANKVYWTLLS